MSPEPRALPTLAELRRYFCTVDPHTDCWIWTGPFTSNGYPRLCMGRRRSAYAARLAYELLRGTLPPGRLLKTTCDNRACINPEHRHPLTRAEFNGELAATGRTSRGVVHALAVARGRRRWAKLSPDAASAIRAALARGEKTLALAQHYGVSRQTVYLVGKNRSWRQASAFGI